MTQQQQIIQSVIRNLEQAIEACNIGIALGEIDKTGLNYSEKKKVFESQVEKLKQTKQMPAEDFLSMISSVNSELQKLK